MRRLATQLPAQTFLAAVPGFGPIGFAQIISEAGDLARYANPGKLWKRMGLAVINGKSQRKCANAEGALEQGYAPRRRSLMYVIGDSLIKKASPFRELYLARKAYEHARAPAMSKMHAHRRAQRYMEKRLLRDLWRAWRADCGRTVEAGASVNSSQDLLNNAPVSIHLQEKTA